MKKNIEKHKIEKKPIDTTKNAIILSVLVCFTFFVFWNSRTFAFVWDDTEYILNNPHIASLSFHAIGSIFTSFYAANYHPLTTLSWAIEYHFWGTQPGAYHIFNVILHVANVCLVYYFVMLLLKDFRIAIITAAVFALHPLHVESIVWISERKDLLYTLFYMAALSFYLIFLEKKKALFLIVTFLFFVLSCLSKSAAVTLPLILILLDYYKDKLSIKAVIQKIPFLVLSIGFGIIAILSQKSNSAFNKIILDYSFLNRCLLVCYSIYYYLVSFFFPFHLSALHFYPQDQSSLPFDYYIAPLVLIAVGVFVFIHKKYRKELFFGLGFFVSTIALIIQFIPMGSAVVSERYSYVPYIGLSIMLFQILLNITRDSKKAIQNTKLVIAGAGIYILIFAYQSYQRSKIWLSPETLFTDIVNKNPDVYYAYWVRCTARLNDNNFQDCVSDCTIGLRLDPGYSKFYSVRGLALLHLNNFNDGEIYYVRGKARREFKDYNGTIQDFDKALLLNSRLRTAVVYIDLSNLKLSIHDIEGSNAALDMAIAIDPKNIIALFNKGVNCFNTKRFNDAINCFNRALLLNQNDNEIYYNRGLAKSMLGDKDGACADIITAAKLGNFDAKRVSFKCE
jgi:tetratricopeptide (TPR) repeat protein